MKPVDYTTPDDHPLHGLGPVDVVVGGMMVRVRCPKDVAWAQLDGDGLWHPVVLDAWLDTCLEPFQARKVKARIASRQVSWIAVGVALRRALDVYAPHVAELYQALGMVVPPLCTAYEKKAPVRVTGTGTSAPGKAGPFSRLSPGSAQRAHP
jgi:hypothetical protein